MKKGFSVIAVEVPIPTKRYFERQAKKLMVTVSALVRPILMDKAKDADSAKQTQSSEFK